MNFVLFSGLSDCNAPPHHFECGFDYSPTCEDKAPSRTHALLLRSELGLLVGIKLLNGIMTMPLIHRFGSISLLRIVDFALLPLTSGTAVTVVVKIPTETFVSILVPSCIFHTKRVGIHRRYTWRVTAIKHLATEGR